MEFTGGYEYKLVRFCENNSIAYVKLPGLEIKHSLGMIRGKNDKVDSKRIAQYAVQHSESLVPAKPYNQEVEKLKELLKFRKAIVTEQAGYQARVKERKHMYPDLKKDLILRESQKKIKQNKNLVARIEQEILDLIHNNKQMKTNYELITGIKGIGKVNAWMTIAYTGNFT